MKYNGIKIGKPKNYVFVRGTSFQEAASFLFNKEYSVGSIPKKEFSHPMSVQARFDFTRDKVYSHDFMAKEESDILDKSRELASQRATRDYMYIRSFNGMSLGDIFEHHDKIDFWADFGKEVSDNIESLTLSDYYFRSYHEAKDLKGVNIYFNKGLMYNHLIAPSSDLNDRSLYNMVDVMPNLEMN
ncbi:hypothetical protein JXA48_02510 [Candidatus Woesearchaeota archaeon]|nr:hypothetical protein [Candidatus Woesearchaeota archaeon]